MIRLTSRGGASLRAFALGLMMLAPLAASAADAGFTDRIIVKYRASARGRHRLAGTTQMAPGRSPRSASV